MRPAWPGQLPLEALPPPVSSSLPCLISCYFIAYLVLYCGSVAILAAVVNSTVTDIAAAARSGAPRLYDSADRASGQHRPNSPPHRVSHGIGGVVGGCPKMLAVTAGSVFMEAV